MTSLNLLMSIVGAIVSQPAIYLAIGIWRHWHNDHALHALGYQLKRGVSSTAEIPTFTKPTSADRSHALVINSLQKTLAAWCGSATGFRLRMVEEILAAKPIEVTYATVRRCAVGPLGRWAVGPLGR